MYTIDDLNVRLLSELKEIAEEMGVKNAKKLSKQDIIYKILDQQAVSDGEAAAAEKKAVTSTGGTHGNYRSRNLNEKCGPEDVKMLHSRLRQRPLKLNQ